MKQENKILACVDQSAFADDVTDCATWVAKKLAAPLELLHVIDQHPETSHSQDHSGAIGLDAQEQLLQTLTNEDAVKNKLAREEGRIFLNRLRERSLRHGLPVVDIRQRHGSLVETLVEQEQGVRLFVLGRRGASAGHTQRELGRHVESVVRRLKKPILTVTTGFVEPQNVLIAFDGSAVTKRGVEMVASSPLFQGLSVKLLMSGTETRDCARQLEWGRSILRAAEIDVQALFVPGDAESVIAKFVKDEGMDMLVMGAYGHSPLRSFVFGSKTSDLLRSSTIPTLLLR